MRRIPALVAALAIALLWVPTTTATAADGPTVKVSEPQAGTGGSLVVTGAGWQPKTLLMMLICGRSAPGRGVIGGTNSCANADGRAVTTDANGGFSKSLPVVEPPVPCPCVVHVVTVTGSSPAAGDAAFQVAGHPVEPLPAQVGTGRLSVLTDPLLDGSSGLLTWFGAPPGRTLAVTVGNLGTAAVKDPVFQIGTSHGVFAPQWDEQQWRGTIPPGGKARVELPVTLASGAHGDYTVSLKYGGKVLAEQPWGVGRPWGVTLFWVLAGVVVPAALFRVGMAVVDRVRPRGPGGAGGAGGRAPVRHGRALRRPEPTLRMPRLSGRKGHEQPEPVAASTTLPWFTPEADPGAGTDAGIGAGVDTGAGTATTNTTKTKGNT
ncbi:hypothetical protein ACKI1I_39900 [Streptomyces turgidiscabies]|uniref:Neocarzinostatin family protein n=1 Tax=Streptomyces turgidiscabies (strain Car8) TaxID=698760 RepID=L7EQL9_STRT8|nr:MULTISPECIES: hypothetical protein [Streptomyces]ELP61347.1 hypothetical protein STRTUCAR8_06704 [Streptomyces turgidiscabies Car8]MDX3493505.1 hypothetical protein [Streptomyces turgidiscabies]GAQ76802.1 hypothetical protein T45_08606 [Streptomyces turgidiscabies]